VDFDDSVITVHGEQENSEVGYNPRYRGRPSYKVKVGFISELDLLLNIGLYNGKTASNGGFYPFLEKTLEIARNFGPLVIQGVRMDKGFFDQDNFEKLEEENIDYVCKVPLRQTIKKMLAYIDETNDWTSLSETYDSAELTYPCPAGRKQGVLSLSGRKWRGMRTAFFREQPSIIVMKSWSQISMI